MENNYGMLLVLLFPIISGIIGFYLGKKNKETRNDWVDIVMTVEFVMLAYFGYIIIGKGTTVSLSLSDFLGMGLSLTMDTVRMLFCMVTTIVYGVITQFMKVSMKQEKSSNRFYLFYLCSYAMVLGAFMTNNLFNFLMFIVFAFCFAYPMIVHRKDKLAVKNARIYTIFLLAGIVIFITGLVIVFAALGSVSYNGMYTAIHSSGGNAIVLIGGLLMMLGFGIFSGIFPVQFQITRGASHGLIEASTIVSSVLSKLGILGLMILAGNLFMQNALFGRILLICSLLTAIWGLLISFTSTDIRKILMGIDVAVNGINTLGVSLMVFAGSSNGYAIRSCVYFLIVSSLSLLVLYMVALEQVREINTYEIKGLIASGKKNKMLAVVCFLAGVSLCGLPGTAGFLAHSMLYKTLVSIIRWKWLIVVYIIIWAFFATAVTRVFMKLFVSKKEETIRILTTEEELQASDQSVSEDTANEEGLAKQKTKSPYFFGEVLLLLVGIFQIVIGVIPNLTVDKLARDILDFFHGEMLSTSIPYFTSDAFLAVAIVLILSVLFYVNLVHGVLLRAVRNKKNRKLKKEAEAAIKENENIE